VAKEMGCITRRRQVHEIIIGITMAAGIITIGITVSLRLIIAAVSLFATVTPDH
jgi:hypothetical protein